MIAPSSYELKRFVARHRERFWRAEALAGLPAAYIYLFPDQERFDSDEINLIARRICAAPLSLPHEAVIFEVADCGPRFSAQVAFVWQGARGPEAALIMRARDRRQWTDMLCHAAFRADGWADVQPNPALAGDRETWDGYAAALTGIVWRALAILSLGPQVSEHALSRVRRARFASSGISGWNYRVVDIDPVRTASGAHHCGGTHASPRWHIRRGHWRRLADGRRIFVRECEVGDVARGGVVKDYRIAMEEAA